MKCNLCDFETENSKTMSNHKRWKHILTKNSVEYKNFLNKLSTSASVEKVTKTCICQRCGKEFVQTASVRSWETGKSIKKFCSSYCAHSRVQTEETKQKIKQKIVEMSEPEQAKVCPVCGKEYFGRTKYCSKQCGYEARYGKVDLEKMKDYRRACSFDFSLNEYPEEFDFKLIESYGWYAPSTSKKPNINGVSRDHMLSVRYGFDHNIDPKIIKHPANCKLLTQHENAMKHSDCSITLEELLERIAAWDKKYG